MEIGAYGTKNGEPITTTLTNEANAVLVALARNNETYVFSTTGGTGLLVISAA